MQAATAFQNDSKVPGYSQLGTCQELIQIALASGTLVGGHGSALASYAEQCDTTLIAAVPYIKGRPHPSAVSGVWV